MVGLRNIRKHFRHPRRSLAIFSSYFETEQLPQYVKDYLFQLSNHFDQIILVTTTDLTTEEDLSFMADHDIQLQVVINEGFDFGMYTKALKKLKLNRIAKLGLFNDSTILCGSLDPFFQWERTNPSDVVGMIDSNEVNYHLQSYFLVFKKKSIRFLKRFLAKRQLQEKKLEIIHAVEIGLSQALIEKRFSIEAFFKVDEYEAGFPGNPSFLLLKELLQSRFPVIKKKILTGKFNEGETGSLKVNNFDFSKETYLNIIKKVNLDFELPPEFTQQTHRHEKN